MRQIVVSLDQLRRPSPGGIGTYIRGLVRGLSELIDSGELSAQLVGVAPRGSRALGLDNSHLRVATTWAPEKLSTVLWGTTAFGVPRDADVVHATSMAGPFQGGRASATHSVLVHDLLWRKHPELATARGARFHEARIQTIVAHEQLRVLVTSPGLAKELVDAGVDTKRIFVVRLGVEHDDMVFERSRVLSDPRLRAVLGPEGNYTVAVGTIQPRKNLERLIVAHARARLAEPTLGPLLLVGERGWGSVDTTGSYELGALDDHSLRALVSCARATAYVALEEGWGLPPVESLAQGRPTVAATTVPSVMGNNQVVLVNPLDVDSICEGLVSAAQSDDDDVARERRRRSVSHLTWITCARDHLVAWS
jgi:alpha-1,3-rhamnosyl/mannosyltransferase